LLQKLAPQGTVVSGLHVGYTDTDMMARFDAPKADPAEVAALALDALAAGVPEILADDTSRQLQAGLAGGVAALYPQLV
jgi:NAD(P)-dependent dehydrogenase (short-subunit alcohol dehydrogenase family)